MPILENLCRALGLRNLSVMPANANALNLHMPLSVDEHWGAEPPNPPSREDAEAFVKAQPFWYHRIYLGNGIYTIAGHVSRIGVAMSTRHSLPICTAPSGCGVQRRLFFDSCQLRGAGRVVGVESVDFFFDQPEYIRQIWQLDIKYHLMDAHDVGQIHEQFDLVMYAAFFTT